MRPALRFITTSAAAGMAVLALAGCSGPSVSGSNNPGVQDRATVAPGAAGDAQRFTVATSSLPDLAAALKTNGVGSPEKWAQIVQTSGPYPSGPGGQAKLREVLTRFQADPDDIAKITNTLVP
jgi:hypothetical protein